MIEGEHLVSVLATNVKHLAREREGGDRERERESVWAEGGGYCGLVPCLCMQQIPKRSSCAGFCLHSG